MVAKSEFPCLVLIYILTYVSQRLYEWFYNNSPARQTSGKGSKLLVNMFKRTRMMHVSQAYLHLCQDRLMPILKAEYPEYLKDPGPTRKKGMGAFAFRNDRAGELYEEASDKIKAIVEKYRRGALDLDDEDLQGDDDEEDMEDLRAFLQLEADEKLQEKDM